MFDKTFFRVVKSNLKCAVCEVKHCPVKYFPDRQVKHHYGGSRYITRCEKDQKEYKSNHNRKYCGSFFDNRFRITGKNIFCWE